MLQVSVAETAVMRAVLDLGNGEFLRCLWNRCEIIECLVMLGASPDLDLPCSMLGTGLDDVNRIVFDDLLGLDGPHAFRTKSVGLPNLLGHC